MNRFKGIIWDFGGVITESPFEAFNRFEIEMNIPLDFIRSVNAKNPTTNAWALFESSKIDLDEFDKLFHGETKSAGYAIQGKKVIPLLSGKIRKKMVSVLSHLRKEYKQLCLTNNIKTGFVPRMPGTSASGKKAEEVMVLFDEIIESSKVGLRKPDQKIYEMARDRLGFMCSEIVYLDDLGINLKPARIMGISTIKVLSAEQAISDLGAMIGEDLLPIVENQGVPQC